MGRSKITSGSHPYDALTSTICRETQAEAVFAYFDSGIYGTEWCAVASRDLAANLPELLRASADEMLSDRVVPDTDSVIFTPVEPAGHYADVAEKAASLAKARWVFLLVFEGARGTNWSMFAKSTDRPEIIADTIHGVADEISQKQARKRMELGLEVAH
jgi:hypothetical protein